MGAGFKIVAITMILATAVSPAMADQFLAHISPESPGNLNTYFALDVGQTSATDLCTGLPLPSGTTGCQDTATLYRAAIGGQITPMWGTEVSYGDLGKAKVGTLGSASVDWQMTALQVSATGIYPISNAFSLIGKLGVVLTDLKLTNGGNSTSDTKTNLAFGIGAQYDFTKSVAIRAQYEDLGIVGNANSTGTTKVVLFSAGIVLGM